MLSTWRTASHWWVVIPAFLGALSYAMTSAPFQQLVISIICRKIAGTEDPESCRTPEIDSQSSLWILILMLCLTVPSLLTVGTFGALSDRFGRRLIMFIPVVGLLLNRVAISLIVWYHVATPEWLIAGQIVQGLLGGMPTLFMTCFAYTADCADSTKRSAHFGILEAFLFLGFVVGPFAGGALSRVDKTFPFIVSGALNVLTCALVRLAPESLPPGRRTPRVEWNKANVFGAVGVLGTSAQVVLLALGFALVVVCYNAFVLVFVIYADTAFGWKEYEDGIFLSVQWSARSVGVGLLLPLLLKIQRFWVEGWIVRLGTVAYLGAFLFYGLATTELLFFMGTIFDGIGAMVLPVYRSLLSRSVLAHEQGRILSATGVLEGAAEICAPLVFNFSLAYLVAYDPRIVFFMMCGVVGLAFITTLFLTRKAKTTEERPLFEGIPEDNVYDSASGTDLEGKETHYGAIN